MVLYMVPYLEKLTGLMDRDVRAFASHRGAAPVIFTSMRKVSGGRRDTGEETSCLRQKSEALEMDSVSACMKPVGWQLLKSPARISESKVIRKSGSSFPNHIECS